MTSSEIVPTGGSAIEQFMAEHGGAPVGLEDVNSSDIVMSKITINHEEGLFVDSLTGETFESLDTVLLGVIKGRVLWDTDLDSKNPLLCKSNDGVHGNPTDVFPVKAFTDKGGVYVPEGKIECESCPLGKWGSHPKDDKPWCTEQMTFPLTLSDPTQVGGTITFQRSGLSPTRAYLSAFVRENKPMFTHRTTITLDRARTGSVKYATPKFVRGEAIDDLGLLRSYAEQYSRVRALFSQAGHDEAAAPVVPSAAPVIEGSLVGEVGNSPF